MRWHRRRVELRGWTGRARDVRARSARSEDPHPEAHAAAATPPASCSPLGGPLPRPGLGRGAGFPFRCEGARTEGALTGRNLVRSTPGSDTSAGRATHRCRDYPSRLAWRVAHEPPGGDTLKLLGRAAWTLRLPRARFRGHGHPGTLRPCTLTPSIRCLVLGHHLPGGEGGCTPLYPPPLSAELIADCHKQGPYHRPERIPGPLSSVESITFGLPPRRGASSKRREGCESFAVLFDSCTPGVQGQSSGLGWEGVRGSYLCPFLLAFVTHGATLLARDAVPAGSALGSRLPTLGCVPGRWRIIAAPGARPSLLGSRRSL